MIKLFEEWANQEPSFVKISLSEFDDNEESVQLREVDKKRIKLIFEGWEFKEDTYPHIHMVNVTFTHYVYLLIREGRDYILFWKDEADYFYVYHLPVNLRGMQFTRSRHDTIRYINQSYKCDQLDGFEDLKNYLESAR